MPWHLLSERVSSALKTYVNGKVVADIGAGDLSHSRTMSELGAKEVLAIDPGLSIYEQVPANVKLLKGYAKDTSIPEELDVVFLAWPVNREIPGIDSWIAKARTVIYFGCNDNYTVCGGKDLWSILPGRAILHHFEIEPTAHESSASFTVYGEPLEEPRELTPEEKRAITVWAGSSSVKIGRRGDMPKKTKPSGF